MTNGHDQLRAGLQWEAACERVRNTLRPPAGAPVATSWEQAEAMRLCHVALMVLEQAYAISPRPDDIDDFAPRAPGSDGPDDRVGGAVSGWLSGRQG